MLLIRSTEELRKINKPRAAFKAKGRQMHSLLEIDRSTNSQSHMLTSIGRCWGNGVSPRITSQPVPLTMRMSSLRQATTAEKQCNLYSPSDYVRGNDDDHGLKSLQ